VTSWAPGRRDTLDLFIEPRRGLTHELLKYTKNDNVAMSRLVLFSGPYRTSIDIGKYKKIVIVANGFGIVIYLLYLRQLIYGYNSRKIRIRRIHLV
jgi:NAD(P)H-flavin reductase